MQPLLYTIVYYIVGWLTGIKIRLAGECEFSALPVADTREHICAPNGPAIAPARHRRGRAVHLIGGQDCIACIVRQSTNAGAAYASECVVFVVWFQWANMRDKSTCPCMHELINHSARLSRNGNDNDTRLGGDLYLSSNELFNPIIYAPNATNRRVGERVWLGCWYCSFLFEL